MARWSKQVSEVLRAWKASEIGLSTAAQRLVSLGWSSDAAWAFLERY